MRNSLLLTFAVAALTAASLAQTPAKSAKNPWIGSWKMDTAASQFHNKGPKSETLHITAAGKSGFAYSIDSTDSDGGTSRMTYHSTGEGKEASDMMNGKKADTASFKMPDQNTIAGEGEMPDGTKWTMNATMSDDKQTMTAKFHYTPKSGDAYDDTEVYKK